MRLCCLNIANDQSNNPPIPTSSSSAGGGASTLGAYFFASGFFSSFFFSSFWGAGSDAAKRSSSLILNLNKIGKVPWLEWESGNVSKWVSDDQRNSGLNGVSSRQWKTSNVSNSDFELSDQGRWVDVDDILWENGSIIVDSGDLHTVLEGLDVEFFE